MRLGDLELRQVSDGRFRLDGGMMFGVVPRVLWQRRFEPDAENRVGLELNCLLIQGHGENVLVDTGLGTNLTERQLRQIWGLAPSVRLLDNLAAIGLAAEDITMVINTHLHVDHCGGNTVGREGKLVPAFPRARYLVQRREWEDATNVNERTRAAYFPEHLMPLAEAGVLDLLDGEVQVNSFLRCIPTPGHTPGHQSVLVGAGEEKALHLGDAAPFAVHFERLAWIPAIDLLPLATLEAKRSLLREVLEHDYLLIFYHEHAISAGRLVHEDDEYRVVPVPLS